MNTQKEQSLTHTRPGAPGWIRSRAIDRRVNEDRESRRSPGPTRSSLRAAIRAESIPQLPPAAFLTKRSSKVFAVSTLALAISLSAESSSSAAFIPSGVMMPVLE
jgi:hypothetical protein